MKIELWFPTPIYSHDADPKEIQLIKGELDQAMEREFCALQDAPDTNARSYTQSREPEHRQIIQKYELRNFLRFLTNHGTIFTQKLYPQASAIDIRESWFNFYEPGDCQEMHNHVHPIHPSFLSGVYYLRAPENSGDLKFYHSNFNTAIPEPNGGMETIDASYPPVENKLILFRSHVPHSVMRNRSDQQRVSLSFNIYVR